MPSLLRFNNRAPAHKSVLAMLKFKKYSSIENAITRDFMERVRAEMPADLEWVVQEKVHGANTNFLCDGLEVKFAKRTSVLTDDEKFYDFQSLVDSYKSRVISLFNSVKKTYPGVEAISVFGEMFGGRYAHPNVPAEKGTTLIQKGVNYTPGHEFYGFDIYIFEGEESRFLPVDEVNAIFEAEGFFCAKTLPRLAGGMPQISQRLSEQNLAVAWLSRHRRQHLRGGGDSACRASVSAQRIARPYQEQECPLR